MGSTILSEIGEVLPNPVRWELAKNSSLKIDSLRL